MAKKIKKAAPAKAAPARAPVQAARCPRCDNKGKYTLAVPGGLFLGMGFGFLINNIPAGVFMGLGGGFLFLLWKCCR